MNFKECYSDTVSSVSAAARAGCRRRVRTLIHRGCSIDSRDNRGWNALHEAAAAGSMECVRELLSAAASSTRGGSSYLGARTHEGESALHLAAQYGNLAVVRLLVNARAKINQLTNDGSSPLYAAVDAGHKDVVELLVRKGAKINGKHTSSCWSCLHQASYKGHSDIVRLLVAVPGCQLEVRDDHDITPLFVAAQYGQKQCLQILADAGADVNTQAGDLATPLLIASQEGHEGCVDVLLAHDANPNLVCSVEWAQLPIHAAAEFGHISILKCLIAVTDRACDRDVDMVSPVYSALSQRESMRLLLEEGFHPDAQDCSSFLFYKSPLTKTLDAAQTPSDTAQLLIAAGASLDPNVWIYALNTDNPETLQLILKYREISLGRTISGPDQQTWGIPSPQQSSETMSSPEQSSGSMSSPELSSWTMSSPEQSSWTMSSSDQSSENTTSPEQSSGKMSRPGQSSMNMSIREQPKDLWLNAEELTGLVSVALKTVDYATWWLPLLLQAGLEPSLLLHPNMLKQANNEVLNYFLEFVNWSILPRHLGQILEQRQEEKSWIPNTHQECVPSLSHLCRLQVRKCLGAYTLMRSTVVQQLPLPPPLQRYLQFTDLQTP